MLLLMIISFRVNDMSAANEVYNRGFKQQPQNTLSNDRKRKVLLAKALKDNNNINISCTAINSENVYSNNAVLRIQGELML